jgi:hypothetical protein
VGAALSFLHRPCDEFSYALHYFRDVGAHVDGLWISLMVVDNFGRRDTAVMGALRDR